VPLVLAGGGVALAAAEKVVVHVPELAIRPNTTAFGMPVETVKDSATLEVLSHENGGWLKVRTSSGKEGYVKEAALTARSLAPAKSFAAGDAASSGTGAALATKGLEQDTVKYASTNRYNTTGVVKMIATHESITPEEFIRFEQEGRVGEAQKR
jgi:hypothetical protein